MSIPSSSISTASPDRRTLGGTSLIIKEALDDRGELPRPIERENFRDTLARLSAKHESSEEDNPESDTAYQELLKPIKPEISIVPPPPVARDFTHFANTPERPRTSPSRLALSVELHPHEDILSRHHRHRLELLAPLPGDITPRPSSDDPKTIPLTFDSEAHIEPLSEFTERHAQTPELDAEPDVLADLRPQEDSAQSERAFSREQAPAASIKNLTLPRLTDPAPAVAASAQAATPPQSEPAQPAPTNLSIRAEHTSGALTAEAVERTHIARRVALSMENSPLGQKLELDIKDIFGQPLKLKIVFEDQRARATCFGSQFHDPDQLEHVLDSVRTALEASGFELGDFIMHHHRDRRSPQQELAASGDSPPSEQEAEPPVRKEILRIVGIVNRIA